MVKDKRHKTVKILIEGGHVTQFREIFEHIPKTTVAEQLGIHFNRFNNFIDHPAEMKVSDLFLLSAYFEIEGQKMFELINNQVSSIRKGTAKKK
jgi:hypothetical protein